MTTAQPTDVTAALVGNRRAHQYLRLLDLGRRSEAVSFLDGIADGPEPARAVAELIFMGGTLRSVADTIATRLAGGLRDEAEQSQAELLARRNAAKGDPTALRSWLEDAATEALRVTSLLWPHRRDRIRFFEASARTAFHGEESGSHVRRTAFGES